MTTVTRDDSKLSRAMGTNDNSSTDADHNGKTTQPSPNEAKFDEVVKALLAENHTHHDLKLRLRRLVMEEAQKLPPVKVVYSASYGGIWFSKGFDTFVSGTKYYSRRSDPAFIQAISDYGRFICDKFPFILDDMRTVYTWKLDKLLAKLRKEYTLVETKTEFDPDLVAEATSFINQMCDAEGHWRADCLGTFPDGKPSLYSNERPEIDLMAFTGMHPDFWMAHCSLNPDSIVVSHKTFQVALRFAHILSQGGDHARYHVEPEEAQDAAIYERLGVFGATSSSSHLAIKEIPALVDYSIHEYDGLESVIY